MALAHVRVHFVGKHIYLERASSLYIHHSLLHSFVVRKRRKRDRVFLDCTHQAVVITFWTQFLCSLGSLTRSVPLSHVLCTKIPLSEICPWYVFNIIWDASLDNLPAQALQLGMKNGLGEGGHWDFRMLSFRIKSTFYLDWTRSIGLDN